MPAALASLLVFAAASVLTALALVMPGHRGLDHEIAALALAVGAAAACGAFIHTRQLPPPRVLKRHISAWGWLAFIAFALFALRTYCWLFYFVDDHIKVGSPNNLGDLSLHLLLAQSFTNGVHWWPEHPQDAWLSMRYYPGVDMFQSLLMLVGVDTSHALVWLGLCGSAAAAIALFEWGGSFTVAGFLFSGGLAGYQIFHNGGHFIDYQAGLAWKSLPLAIFVTQRGFLYALPAGLLLLTHWRERLFSAPAKTATDPAVDPPLNPGLLPFWVEALLYAAMPLFHLYAFVFLSALLGWWFAVYFARRGVRLHIFGLVCVAFLPAAAQVGLMTNYFAGTGDTLWVEMGWMRHRMPFLRFWLLNFGLFAVLAPALWARCAWDLAQPDEPPLPAEAGGKRLPSITRSQDTAAAFVLPAGLLFVFACVVMLSPWDWDNTKLMIWSYLVALPFIWQRWIRPFSAPGRWLLCAILFLSGGVSLIGGLGPANIGFDLGSRREIDAVRYATRALPPESRFAAAPEYNHPLVFCGRKLAMGYDGHLYSQGIDYGRLSADLRMLMLGQATWRHAARRLGVRFIYWGPREQSAYPDTTRAWALDNPPLASGEWGAIYEVKNQRTERPPPSENDE